MKHINVRTGRSFSSDLPNISSVRGGSSSLSASTQRLEPMIESLGHSSERGFEGASKTFQKN